MQKAKFIVAALLLGASALYAQSTPSPSRESSPGMAEPRLFGTWVSVYRSAGGLGSTCTFHPGGKLELGMGAIVEGWYRVEGNKLIKPSGSSVPGAVPEVTTFRVKGNTLTEKKTGTASGPELRFTRVGKAETGSAPIVGVWRGTISPLSLIEEHRKRGLPMDRRTAKLTADKMNSQFLEYTRDGLIKLRLLMQTRSTIYDLASRTFALPAPPAESSSAKLDGSFRIESDFLVMRHPNGQEEWYIRADASKAALERAGVRYGDKPAEFNPSSK